MPVAFLFLVCFSLMPGTEASAKNDWENWNTLTYIRTINSKDAFSIAAATRSKDEMRRLYYERMVLTYSHKLPRNWKLELGYSPYRSRGSQNWAGTDIYSIAGIYANKTGFWKSDARFQWEFNSHTEEDILRIRLRVERAIKAPCGLFLSFSAEPLLNLDAEKISEQRYETRLSWNALGGTAYVGFLLRAKRSGSKFIETNILTTGIKWRN